MSQVLKEKKLQFTFDGKWRCIKYDDTPIYRERIGKLKGTKAVDFVAVHRKTDFYLIEVKDYRGYRIQKKNRTPDSELAVQVARKVRDSIAGIFGTNRSPVDDESGVLRSFGDAQRPGSRLKVVLWLEEDRPSGRDIRAPGRQSMLLKDLKQHLRWLEAKVSVESMGNSRMPGVRVKNLAGAGQGG